MRALFIIDVQNDFTEGGALGVEGGSAVATGIAAMLTEHPQRYDVVFASRDWHDGDNDNGGHFASGEPDFIDTWPVHCVAGTYGAEWVRLREDARKRQGDRFDIRQFHEVLRRGRMPLVVLEHVVKTTLV